MDATAIQKAQIAQHLKVAIGAIVRVEQWASVWFAVARGLGARFISKKVVVKLEEIQKPPVLEAYAYERKGRNAWLAKIEIDGDRIANRDFYSPWEKDRECYAGKLGKVCWRLSSLPDGLYELDQANSNVMSGVKTYRSYLQVENHQVVEEWESLGELVKAKFPPAAPADAPELPALEGSPKQVAWAEDIRAKAIKGGFPVEKAVKILDAKKWIDNRNMLSTCYAAPASAPTTSRKDYRSDTEKALDGMYGRGGWDKWDREDFEG